MQAAFTASAKLDKKSKVEAIKISGRPKGRFKGGAQGSHVTAYGIFRDVLESATLGRTVNKAYANVERLIEDLEEIPGYKNFRNKELPADQPKARKTNQVKMYELQELMSYYLEARDAAGYSAAFLGDGMAKGKGEGSILRRLRELENEGGLSIAEIPEAKTLVDGLYDEDAVDQLVDEASSKKLGGLRRDRARRQHLMTVYQAFPEVYNDLHNADKAGYPSFATEISQKKTKGQYERPTARDLFQDLGVTAVPNGSGGYTLTVSGRPSGPFSQSSKMGSHTIAWSLVVEAMKNQISGAKNAKQVRARLLDLLEMQEESPMTARKFRKNQSLNAKNRVKEADEILDSSQGSLESLSSRELLSTDVETAVEAALLHHNVNPLSATDQGLANNKAEQTALANLRRYESGFFGKKPGAVKRSNAVNYVYALLDGSTIDKLAATKGSNPSFPGARGEPDEEIGAILDMFFRYVRAAFPKVYAEAKPHHEDNIAHYLTGRLGLRLDPEDITWEMETRTASGSLARGSSLEAYDNRQSRLSRRKGVKRRRSFDDGDYLPPGKKQKNRRIVKARRRR